MKKMESRKTATHNDIEKERCSYPAVGTIAPPSTPGRIMVSFDGQAPVPARLLSTINRNELSKEESIGRQVLCMFEKGMKELPIIVGQLENLIDDIISMEITPEEPPPLESVEVEVDKERIVLEAQKEILLKCGKASIKLRQDGKIVIKGADLLSRSSGGNRIKGGSVGIN